MNNDRQQKRSVPMEALGRPGMGRGYAMKSVLARRPALGVSPTIAVDPMGQWGGVLEHLGGREVSLDWSERIDPLWCVHQDMATVRRGD